jgi:tetratricopeptide (TPR) repeat protein
MDAVQFGQWMSKRRHACGFRSQRTLAETTSVDSTAAQPAISENFLARLEAGQLAHPFRGSVRRRVLALAWYLCKTPQDVKVYLRAAGLTELQADETEQIRQLHQYLGTAQTQQKLPLPPRPMRLIGREPLLQELVNTIPTMDMGVYAITGMPGVGKSALASEVVHRLAANERVRAFPDGIAVFTCSGRRGSSGLIALLDDIITVFDTQATAHSGGGSRRSSHKSLRHTSSEARRAQGIACGQGEQVAPTRDDQAWEASKHSRGDALCSPWDLASMIDHARLALMNKRALLLLDDVDAQFPLRQALEAVQGQDRLPLAHQRGNAGGYAQRVVLTTGCFIPLPALVTHHLHLAPLDPIAALECFTALLNRPLHADEMDDAKRLCAALGYLPLALEVAASAVVVAGIPLSFLVAHADQNPLNDLLDGEQELRSRLAQAFESFDTEIQKRFALLSTLGVPSFGLESAAALRAITSEQLANAAADLGQLVRHSLVDLVQPPLLNAISDHRVPARGTPTMDGLAHEVPLPAGNTMDYARYQLHPLLYAQSVNSLKQLEAEEIEKARGNVQAYALGYIERHRWDISYLERERDFLFAALKEALFTEQYEHVVRFVDGLRHVSNNLPNPEEKKRFYLWGIHASQYLHDRQYQSCFMNDLGHVYLEQGEFLQAKQVWTESLEIVASLKQPAPVHLWGALSNLGDLAYIQGEGDAAMEYAEMYLKRYQNSDNAIRTADAHYCYAVYARLQGQLDRAYRSVSSAMDILSQRGQIPESSLENFIKLRVHAELARVQGDYSASQVPIELAASLIQQRGNYHLLADLLLEQARFARNQGRHHDARHLAQRVAQVAEQMKFPLYHQLGTQLLQQLAGTAPLSSI